jgi:hypothetical protein
MWFSAGAVQRCCDHDFRHRVDSPHSQGVVQTQPAEAAMAHKDFRGWPILAAAVIRRVLYRHHSVCLNTHSVTTRKQHHQSAALVRK